MITLTPPPLTGFKTLQEAEKYLRDLHRDLELQLTKLDDKTVDGGGA